MRNFAYFCINGLDSYVCTWIYMFFTKYEYFMYFLVSRFFTRFFSRFRSGFRSGSHFGLRRFDDRSGSDNIDWDSCWVMIAKYRCIFDEVITLSALSNLHWTEVPCFWIDVMLLMDLLRDLSSTFFTGRIFVTHKLKDRICSRKAILASCYRLDKNMISHKPQYG